MRINEILVESVQLDEGPFSDVAKKVGTGVGRAVGGVAKGVGAVAGGIAGIGKAVKKGYQAGKATVAGDDEEEPAANAAPTAQQINQQGPKGKAQANTAASASPIAKQAAPAAQPNTASPASAASKIGAPQAKAAVDQAVNVVKTMRGDRRPQVIDYAKKQLDAIAKQPERNVGKTATQTKKVDFTPAGTTQTASIQRSGKVMAESFSIYRKR